VGVSASERRILSRSAVTRAGFVALAGRPNVGKSTLLNAVVGEKVAIVSDRAQTTRRAIRGVHTVQESQMVLVDLPGVQRPRDVLTARMAQRVREELQGADAALLLLSGEQGVGPGDRFIARALAQAPPPVAIAVNKVDRLSRAQTLAALQGAADLELEGEVFPISARTGEGVGELVGHLRELLPEGPFLFAVDARSDQPLQLLLAELIREAAIRRTFHELPHAVEVVVEEVEEVAGRGSPDRSETGQRTGLVRVRALVWVESASQKGILLGARGRMIKAIGSAARGELERELGYPVHLDLSVRVRRDWRRDDGLLDRLGIT
jgi:GTP-binding protein Era